MQECQMKVGDGMDRQAQIMELVNENNGTITTAQIIKAGISRGSLKCLVDKGVLEHSARGVYILPELFDDELFNIQSRFKKGVFSGETALYLHGLTDRTPSRFEMTFPLNYNTSNLEAENIRAVRVKMELHDIGVINVKTPAGNLVRAYDVERTLCDILKGRSNTDIQIISEVFKKYTSGSRKNIPLLSRYAKMLRVEKRVRAYLEVLI